VSAAGALPHPGGHLVLFGRETVYVAGLYLRQAAIFSALGLAIVISLDGANNSASILSAPLERSGLEGPWRLGYYLFLRGAYVLPSILPIAAIVGVVWAEFILAVSRERFMLSNSGRSPTRSLIPAMVFGLLLGLLQFAAIAYGRPAAVEAQTSMHFRYYGPRYATPVTTEPRWLAAGQAVVHGQVVLDGEVSLRDVLVYAFDAGGRLEAVVSAARAVPGPGRNVWTFEQGSSWDVSRATLAGAGAMSLVAADFASLRRVLQLDPVWLRNIDLLPPLLPQADLSVLAAGGPGVPDATQYQAAFHERLAGIFFCLGMAMLGAVLSMQAFFPGMGPMPALKVGLAGGIAYVASNASSMLGTYGVTPPLVAAWSVPVALIVLALALVYRRHLAVRRQLREILSAR
jgi:lipopolysaccharide export system permease protein